MDKRKVFVIPHSHWDREWYFSQEDAKLVLSQNMSFLLDYLAAHPEFPCYVFDGQTSVMVDFLDLYPEKRELAEELIAAGRLKIGPWYTQCDTLLNQTESVIRNLLLGKSGAERLGGAMAVGYLPDIFGQNAYLPSIFKRFGLPYALVQRGLYTAQIAQDLNFIWQSPNGESIQANNLFFGYGPGKFLASDASYVYQVLLPLLDRLALMTPTTKPLLLPAGGDQVLLRPHFPQVVAELNQLDLPYEFELASYEAFMAASSATTVISGELLACQQSRIHNTIRSQRADLKMLNARVEEKLYQQLEPLAVLANTLGVEYPQAWINRCLRDLFDAQAHDSLGGCNSDETNLAIQQRLLKIERSLDGLMNILKKQLARGIGAGTVAAFQLSPKATTRNVKFVLFTREREVALKDLTQTLLKQSFISGGKQVQLTAEGEQELGLPGYYRSEILARCHFNGFGYQTFELESQEAPGFDLDGEEVSNEFYSCRCVGGRLQLQRLADGLVKENWFDFENSIDAGDSYDYSPAAGDLPTFSGDFQLLGVKRSALVSEMQVSCELAGQRIDTTLTLEAGSDLIHISHKINNQAKDHRVRVRFHGENTEGRSLGDQGYTLQGRPNINPHLASWREEGFVESPQAIYPLERFVMVPEETGSISLYTRGLKEYKATADSLLLTLFRSVGLLGRDDLAWRPGRASGINNKVVETPDAQLQGHLDFDYAYRWAEGTDVEAAYQAAEGFAQTVLTYQLQDLNTFEERLERFELPQPEGLHDLPAAVAALTLPETLFVSSFKKAEDSENYILRVFNPTGAPVLLPDFERVDLAENPLSPTEKKGELAARDFASLLWRK